MWALMRSERRRALSFSAPPGPQVLPEAAAEVLAILSSAYVVLDSSGDVLRASPLAYSYGIVRAAGGDHPRLANSELMELAADVGRNGGFRDERLSLRRSSQGDSDAVIDVRIGDRKSTRLNSSHVAISYAVFCLKKKNAKHRGQRAGAGR